MRTFYYSLFVLLFCSLSGLVASSQNNRINDMVQFLLSASKDNQEAPAGWRTEYVYRQTHDKDKVFVNDEEKKVVIAYGGTEPANLMDWAHDLDARKVPLVVGDVDYGKVHRGFLNEFKKTEEKVFDATMPYVKKGYSVEFTGHSQGGAVATIASAYAKDKYGIKNPRVITVGSPRTGDAKFVEQYNSRVPDNTRVIDSYTVKGKTIEDAVPNIPMGMIGFEHVGKKVVVSTGEENGIGARILDHLLPSYDRATKDKPELENQFPSEPSKLRIVSRRLRPMNLISKNPSIQDKTPTLSLHGLLNFLAANQPHSSDSDTKRQRRSDKSDRRDRRSNTHSRSNSSRRSNNKQTHPEEIKDALQEGLPTDVLRLVEDALQEDQTTDAPLQEVDVRTADVHQEDQVEITDLPVVDEQVDVQTTDVILLVVVGAPEVDVHHRGDIAEIADHLVAQTIDVLQGDHLLARVEVIDHPGGLVITDALLQEVDVLQEVEGLLTDVLLQEVDVQTTEEDLVETIDHLVEDVLLEDQTADVLQEDLVEATDHLVAEERVDVHQEDPVEVVDQEGRITDAPLQEVDVHLEIEGHLIDDLLREVDAHLEIEGHLVDDLHLVVEDILAEVDVRHLEVDHHPLVEGHHQDPVDHQIDLVQDAPQQEGQVTDSHQILKDAPHLADHTATQPQDPVTARW
ncbi:hypothetical protein AKO1_007760 [Acrasis kona]|uniref:Fungal lipase-type domain-containing protein n=1 Tax=Acrasis kona TaxID=1008807 RepID=A0AAW2YRP3_9EUKA